MDARDHSTQLTNPHDREFPTANVEEITTWTDYWIANEMPEPQVVLAFYVADIEQEGAQILVKLPEIDMMSYARGVGALVPDEEAEDEGWDGGSY